MKKYLETFFLGMIAALGSLVAITAISVFFGSVFPNVPKETYGVIMPFLLFAVIIEEGFKLLIIRKKISEGEGNRFFLGKAFFLGAGFALMETIFIVSGKPLIGKDELIGIFGISTIHISTAIIIASAFASQKKHVFSKTAYAMLAAIATHATYNYLIFEEKTLQALALSMLLAAVILAMSLAEKKRIFKLA